VVGGEEVGDCYSTRDWCRPVDEVRDSIRIPPDRHGTEGGAQASRAGGRGFLGGWLERGLAAGDCWGFLPYRRQGVAGFDGVAAEHLDGFLAESG